MSVSNGSLLDDDCSDISGWEDLDTGNAVSSQVTFDSKSCFKFDGGNPTGSGYRAVRRIDVGSFGNRVVASLSIYFDVNQIGTRANNNDFQFIVFKNDIRCQISIGSDGLFVRIAGGWVEVGSDIVGTDAWLELTLDINFTTPASATVDVYIDDVLEGDAVSCNYEGSNTDGMIWLGQQNYANPPSKIWHCDWIKVGDNFASAGPTMNQLMRHGCWFDDGVKQSFWRG